MGSCVVGRLHVSLYASAMTPPVLKTLWRKTYISFIDHMRPLLIGICFFTACLSIAMYEFQLQLQGAFVQVFQRIVEADPLFVNGFDSLFELLAQRQAGELSPESILAIERIQSSMVDSFAVLAPLCMAMVIFIGCIVYVSMQFYFIAVIKKKQSTVETIKLELKYFLPNVLLAGWIIIKSFGWLPIIGPVLLLLYVPRYSLASLFLIRDHIGIFTAARKSFAFTRGYWWYIVRSTYTTALIVYAAAALLILLTTVIGFGILTQVIMLSLVIQVGFAILMVFTEQLTSEYIAMQEVRSTSW